MLIRLISFHPCFHFNNINKVINKSIETQILGMIYTELTCAIYFIIKPIVTIRLTWTSVIRIYADMIFCVNV